MNCVEIALVDLAVTERNRSVAVQIFLSLGCGPATTPTSTLLGSFTSVPFDHAASKIFFLASASNPANGQIKELSVSEVFQIKRSRPSTADHPLKVIRKIAAAAPGYGMSLQPSP
jgi:hypothetical protein